MTMKKKFDPLKHIKDLNWVQPEDYEYRLANSISKKQKAKEVRQIRKKHQHLKEMIYFDRGGIAS
jgi:hypothetical protein